MINITEEQFRKIFHIFLIYLEADRKKREEIEENALILAKLYSKTDAVGKVV